jgi:hypothetical protein
VLALAAALLAPSAATACLPPPPGWKEPTHEEKIRRAYESSDDIAYGVTGEGLGGSRLNFRVLHVYKGRLKPGDTIAVEESWGFEGAPCTGILHPPWPAGSGVAGVIGFPHDRPALNWIDSGWLEIMFRNGWIVSARKAAAPPPGPAHPRRPGKEK